MTAPKKTLTKRFITSALLDLMREHSYETISITAITSRADVARATFYRNFQDKDDIIRQYLLRIFYTLDERVEADPTSHWVEHFFVYAYKKRWFFELLYTSNLSHLILEQLEVFWAEKTTDSTIPYVAECLSYGLHGLFGAWVQNGMKQPPEEMCRAYHALRPTKV